MTSRIFLLLMALWPSMVLSHSLSDSFIDLALDDEQVSGHWLIAIRDLELAVGVDANSDTRVTWGEIKQQRAAINEYALSRFAIARAGDACSLQAGEFQLEQRNAGVFLRIPLTGTCGDSGVLDISYSLLFDIDASHRGILSLADEGGSYLRIFSPSEPDHRLDATGSTAVLANLWTFLVEGVWHIWIGLDHILFICALIIPIILGNEVGKRSAQNPAKRNGATISINILKVVTAFTIAHSITLILATLDIVSLPSTLVESVIALSVAVAGINIIFPFFRGQSWKIAFGFGLIHGFGFAGVLGDLSLPSHLFISSLLSFNLGVEIGQLVIVALLLPVLLLLGLTTSTRRLTLIISSLAITAFGLLWLAQRAMPTLAA